MSNLKFNIRKRLYQMPGPYQDNLFRLCSAVGANYYTVCLWARLKKEEKYNVHPDNLYKIADFFKCNPSDLING